MGNFSNEEKMLITYIIQNFPRELSKDFEKQNFSSAKEWFINAAPMVNFYKSYKENINEIEAKYFSKHI